MEHPVRYQDKSALLEPTDRLIDQPLVSDENEGFKDFCGWWIGSIQFRSYA